MDTPVKHNEATIAQAKADADRFLSTVEIHIQHCGSIPTVKLEHLWAFKIIRDALACAEAERDELSAADRRCLQIEARMADCEECNRQLYSELAEARKENARLRTLWTEARVVVAEGRDANCLVSYGATQVEAVEMANAWLDKMQAPSVDEEIARQANDGTLNATIDAAREAGKGGAK